MKAIIQVLLLVIALPYVRTLSCPTNCSKENCEDPTDCQGSVVLDECKCCKTCAKLEGETCGGKFNIQGPCDEGLVCVKTKKLSDTGTCRRAPAEDLCKKKKCGFRQQCTINKHGRAVCICPRNCRESKGRPVCGYKNGKQYRNPCELYRHECRSGKEIGRFNGPCKKCYHHGKPYRLGEARRGQAPCEKCVCYHGDWICKTKNHCQDRIDFCTVFRGPKGDLSSTCPPGYWCKVQIPSIPEQNIPGVGRCASSKSDDANSSTGTTSPSNVSTTTAVTKTKAGDATNPCHLPMQVGPCRASISRWYYNKSRRKCVKFIFGGCGANANNFPTKSSCRSRCMRRRGKLVKTTASIATRPTKAATTSTTTENPKTTKSTGKSLNMTVLCNLPPAPGPCRAAMPQWYYNPKKQRCMRFIYGGCGGNDNNFDTKDECKKACMRNKGTMPPFPTESSTRMTSDSKPSANNTSSTSQTTSSTNTTIHTFPTTKTTKISTTADDTQATQEKQPSRCACSECPSINGKDTCETHYGCFTSQIQHADGTQIVRYGCFGSKEHYIITCNVKIPFKKHPKMLLECCKGHLCNQPPVRSRTDVSQTLNSKPNNTSPTSQTTSSTNTTIHTLPTTKTTKISTTADNTQATQEKQPSRCACSECPSINGKDTCETHYGCFTSQIQHADGTQTVKYGCIANEEHYIITCNVKIPFKKHPKMLLECCKGHLCNQPPVRSRTDVSQTLNKPITTPTQATVVKETASTEIPRCFDAHSSKFYGENEEWKPNDCTVCACHDGHPECVATVCRHPNCVDPIRVKGQCCPVCTANGNATEDSEDMIKALAQSELTTVLVSIKKDKDKRFCEDMNSGELYTVGQNWKVDDCTTCYCQRDGKIACAVQMCNGYPGCPNPVKEKGHCCPVCPEEPEEELVSPENEVINSPHSCLDSVTGDYYRLGEMWQQDDCTGCTCRTGRKSQCRKSTCRKLSCTKPIHLKGRCCPACEDDAKSGCIFEGQKYLPGEYKLLADHCTLCECKNLEWHCSSRKCRKNLNRG